jgi:hypothetical protein
MRFVADPKGLENGFPNAMVETLVVKINII